LKTSVPDFARIDVAMDRGAGGADAPPDSGSLTYEPQLGLREKPFSLASDPRFFYSHSSHGAAFDALAAGIRRREGILALMGEVGTGKTTLCRAVLQALDRRIFAAFVPDPFLSRQDLLKTLLVDFGVVSVDEIRSGRLRGATRTDLSYPLYDFLASLQPLRAFAVVMIDEAHNLTTEVLEEIRILSDLEKNREKLLEVMLIGQPELQKRLASTEMRQLAQRVSLRCELVPLRPDEVHSYISHRLTIAGNDGRVRFTEQAAEAVAAASGGVPRIVNLICDRALLKAALSGTSIVNSGDVSAAAADLQMPMVPVPQVATVARQPEPPVSMPEAMTSPEGTGPDREPTAGRSDRTLAFSRAPQVGWARRRWLAIPVGCAALAVGAGLSVARHSLPRWLQRQPNVIAPAVEAGTEPPLTAGGHIDLPVTTTPAPIEPVSAPTPTFVLQMATFQSSSRTQLAIQELGSAGFRAYSVELAPQDGDRRLMVLLGPYTELAAAEHDLDAARRLPGYDSARVVQAVPALLPPSSQP